MSLCIIYSTITVSNTNSNNYTISRKIVYLPWPSSSPWFGIRRIWINKISYSFYLFTLLGHIALASMNNVVVTVFNLFRALHRRIIVYRILSEIPKLMTHTSEYHCHGTSNLTTKLRQLTVRLFIIYKVAEVAQLLSQSNRGWSALNSRTFRSLTNVYKLKRPIGNNNITHRLPWCSADNSSVSKSNKNILRLHFLLVISAICRPKP